MAETDINGQPLHRAGYCTAWGPERLAEIDREWAEAEGPPEPAPPVANVHLAVELTTGLDAIRDFDFQGRTIRLRSTPYPTAIRLLAWFQQLERLEAMGALLGEHLQELRDCYQEIADLAGTLLVDYQGPNPFLEADPLDFHRIKNFVLDSGNEFRPRNQRGSTRREDTSYGLYLYLAHFGAVLGMVILENGRPQPASWRHYVAGMSYLRRSMAESALGMFDAVASAYGGGDGAQRWLDDQHRLAGQE